jgi:epoxyqueuosine reductase
MEVSLCGVVRIMGVRFGAGKHHARLSPARGTRPLRAGGVADSMRLQEGAAFMARKRKDWLPQAEHYTLVPPVSGNVFNGVGETEPRRPRQIFWLKKTQGHPFGPLQDAVVGRYNAVPQLHAVYANADRGPRFDPGPASPKIEKPAEEWTRAVKAFALEHEADLAGIANAREEWFYEGYGCDLPYIIVFGLAMDHGMLSEQPSTHDNPIAQVEVGNQYNRGARVAARTAKWILEQGWHARIHAGPWVHGLNLVPAAIAAGMGELGKHGSLINRQFGSSFRLAAVETDMPLVADAQDVFGADDFCTRCQVCTDVCPPGAIHDTKGIVRGVEKWWVDFDKCIPYFNETFGCAMCLAACPWSTPGRAPSLAQKWALRRQRKTEG